MAVSLIRVVRFTPRLFVRWFGRGWPWLVGRGLSNRRSIRFLVRGGPPPVPVVVSRASGFGVWGRCGTAAIDDVERFGDAPDGHLFESLGISDDQGVAGSALVQFAVQKDEVAKAGEGWQLMRSRRRCGLGQQRLNGLQIALHFGSGQLGRLALECRDARVRIGIALVHPPRFRPVEAFTRQCGKQLCPCPCLA